MQIIDLETGEVTEVVTDDEVPTRGAPIPFGKFIEEARAIDWVVEDRISARALTVFAGPAKLSRKTLQMLYLSICVARGQPWCGHATRAREVVFVGFEGGRSLMALRIKEVGFERDDPDNPLFASFGYGADTYDWVIARLKYAQKTKTAWPVLIVIDTLSQILAAKGIDENDNTEMTRFCQELDVLADAADAAILTTHHFGKYNATYRGASAIAAGANRCEVHPVKGQPGVLRLDWTLRQGLGGKDAVRVHRPNGKFEFEVLDAGSLPEDEDDKGKRGRGASLVRLRDQVRNYLSARAGQDVAYKVIAHDLAQASQDGPKPMNATTIERKLPQVCAQLLTDGLIEAVMDGLQVSGVRWRA